MKAIYYTLSVTWKEIQVIFRDRAWLVILFLLPLLIGGFMGGMNLATNPPAGADERKPGILLRVGLVNLDTRRFWDGGARKRFRISPSSRCTRLPRSRRGRGGRRPG